MRVKMRTSLHGSAIAIPRNMAQERAAAILRQELQIQTPVDTGRARGAWRIVRLSSGDIRLVNLVSYIRRLMIAGHSKQSRAGAYIRAIAAARGRMLTESLGKGDGRQRRIIDEPKRKQPEKMRRKVTISEASEQLKREGFELGRPEPFKSGDKKTVFKVTEIKTGEFRNVSAKDIRLGKTKESFKFKKHKFPKTEPPKKLKRKATIQDAADRLEKEGFFLGKPVPFRAGQTETLFEVTNLKTGKKKFISAKNIIKGVRF